MLTQEQSAAIEVLLRRGMGIRAIAQELPLRQHLMQPPPDAGALPVSQATPAG